MQDPSGATAVATATVTVSDYVPSKLSGYAYIDVNNNGVKETGETPLGGIVMTLSGTDLSGATVNVQKTTDARGFYQFTDLAPGQYTITQVQPTFLIDGIDSGGTLGTSTGADQLTVNLAAECRRPEPELRRTRADVAAHHRVRLLGLHAARDRPGDHHHRRSRAMVRRGRRMVPRPDAAVSAADQSDVRQAGRHHHRFPAVLDHAELPGPAAGAASGEQRHRAAHAHRRRTRRPVPEVPIALVPVKVRPLRVLCGPAMTRKEKRRLRRITPR